MMTPDQIGKLKPHITCESLVPIPGQLIGVFCCTMKNWNEEWKGYGMTPKDAYDYAKACRVIRFTAMPHIERGPVPKCFTRPSGF